MEMTRLVFIKERMTHTRVFKWKSPNSLIPEKACQVMSKVKSMLTIFFDIKLIVHNEYILAGQTVNFAYYCDVSR
jgi:hypothetical protein